MATNEEMNEVRQTALGDDAVTDNLEDVSPPMSPDPNGHVHSGPQYRADVGVGPWTPPPSAWKLSDRVYLRMKNGKLAGPFHIVKCHEPADSSRKWRYDVKDEYGNLKGGISGSIIV